MATTYPVKLSVTLQTVHSQRAIPVRLGINNNLTTTTVSESTTVNFEFEASEVARLHVIVFDKQEQEAVIVKEISFFGIKDPKFVWAGVYEPEYPEPWATQQKNQGIELKSQLSPHNYLGWNGKWTLTFDIPVFTWIHNQQNLGWIYG